MVTIAVTPCERPGDYDRSIRRLRGEPVRLSFGEDPTHLAEQADGLLLTGGGDVDPSLYGEATHSTFGPAEPGRDAFEIATVRVALGAGLPVLAICRGLQVLNVAAGGTLIQDLPSEGEAFGTHRVFPPATALAHDVHLVAGSRLAVLASSAGGRLSVNSRHHQAARRIGEGLVATAHAPDGVVEGLEAPGHPFCIGVQWHPENFHASGTFDWLFGGFIRACESHRARTRPRREP